MLRNEDTSVSNILASGAGKKLSHKMDNLLKSTRDFNGTLFLTRCVIIGEFFDSRTFRGLEQRIGQTEVSYAEEGRLGTARRYDGEDK